MGVQISTSYAAALSFPGDLLPEFPLKLKRALMNGALYGTTQNGGTSNYCEQANCGCGTVFKIDTSGNENILYRFKGGVDGCEPSAGMISVNGTLYGTTFSGGGNGCLAMRGCGTVFSVNATGTHILYRFKAVTDGAYPDGTLLTVNGALYGTTRSGGDVNDDGTLFEMTLAGRERVLYRFSSAVGLNPIGGLLALDGLLYGITQRGGRAYSGCDGSCGTIFVASTNGTLRTLYKFRGSAGDGYDPASGLVDANGNLYGVTSWGGSGCTWGNDCGTIYEAGTGGVERNIHSFKSNPDGIAPSGNLLVIDGVVYGTTVWGGNRTSDYLGDGVLFTMPVPTAIVKPATTSLYVQWTTKNGPLSALRNLGHDMAFAGYSGLVVLDFGQPTTQNGMYGTWSKILGVPPSDYPFVSIPQISSAAKAYLDGYYQGRINGAQNVLLAIGTNNFCQTVADCQSSWWNGHGAAWATMVNALTGYLFENGRNTQEAVAGANDIEIAWGAVNTKQGVMATFDWLSGYNATTILPMYDFGSLDTCQRGGCHWSPANLWAVSSSGDSYALPEIYCPGQATDWDQLAAWSIKNGHGKLRVAGTMTSPLTPPGTPPCLSKPYTAAQGFDLLWNLLAKDAPGTEDSMIYSTNITYSQQ